MRGERVYICYIFRNFYNDFFFEKKRKKKKEKRKKKPTINLTNYKFIL